MENKIYDNGMCHTGLLHTQLDKSMNVSVFISPKKQRKPLCICPMHFHITYDGSTTKKENSGRISVVVFVCNFPG